MLHERQEFLGVFRQEAQAGIGEGGNVRRGAVGGGHEMVSLCVCLSFDASPDATESEAARIGAILLSGGAPDGRPSEVECPRV
ncbi:hypothetical protein D3C72_2422690 [compost metagenome]